MKRILLSAAFVAAAGAAQAAVISFVPTGTGTVSQSSTLYWNMLGPETSTTTPFSPGSFSLSDHGDVHFEAGSGAFVYSGSGTGGVALDFGTTIGASSTFNTESGYIGTTDYDGGCDFGNTCIYGLSFQLDGNTHYGWVDFTEGTDGTQTLNGWAYEDVAGASIAAGAVSAVPLPASLPLLLAGVAGLGAVSRRARKRR